MTLKEKSKFVCTEAMLNNADRGMVLLNKSKQYGAEQHVSKTKPVYELIKKQSLEIEDVKKLWQHLTKLEKSYNPKQRFQGNTLSPESSSFLAAGGTSGLAWARMILKQEGILKSYSKDIHKELTEKEEQLNGISLPITKALNSELRQVTYIALQPGVDAHGDEITAEEIRKAKENFNERLKVASMANLFHLQSTNGFSVIESYQIPCDVILNSVLVQKSSWLVTLQIHEGYDDLWEMIKNEDIVGVSIGAVANVEPLED